MLCHYRGQEVSQSNIHFLLKHVAWKIDNIHPIDQWTRNLVFHIARADEEHLWEIKRHLQVMIDERVILLGIKYL